jgi:hypothetical protein
MTWSTWNANQVRKGASVTVAPTRPHALVVADICALRRLSLLSGPGREALGGYRRKVPMMAGNQHQSPFAMPFSLGRHGGRGDRQCAGRHDGGDAPEILR